LGVFSHFTELVGSIKKEKIKIKKMVFIASPMTKTFTMLSIMISAFSMNSYSMCGKENQ